MIASPQTSLTPDEYLQFEAGSFLSTNILVAKSTQWQEPPTPITLLPGICLLLFGVTYVGKTVEFTLLTLKLALSNGTVFTIPISWLPVTPRSRNINV